jgi:hypothetical protein
MPRVLARPHLEHDAADAPDVDLGRVALFLGVGRLGRHPKHGALHPGKRGRLELVRPLRNPEVGDLAVARALYEDIVALHILRPTQSRNHVLNKLMATYSVQYTLLVQISQAVEDLRREGFRDVFAKCTELPYTAPDRASGDVLKKAVENVDQLPELAIAEPSHSHCKHSWRRLKAKVLNHVRMLQLLQRVAFRP